MSASCAPDHGGRRRLRACGRLRGAGTAEFLVEGGALSASAPRYFIEMNTRLQVSIRSPSRSPASISSNGSWRRSPPAKLPLSQAQIRMSGHAIEARLNAEDPARASCPRLGRSPPSIRRPSKVCASMPGVEKGSTIPPFYDSRGRQADRVRLRPRPGHSPPRPRAGGDRRCRPQDQRCLPARAHHAPGVPTRRDGYRPDRPRGSTSWRRSHQPARHRLRRHASAGRRMTTAARLTTRRLFAVGCAGRLPAGPPRAPGCCIHDGVARRSRWMEARRSRRYAARRAGGAAAPPSAASASRQRRAPLYVLYDMHRSRWLAGTLSRRHRGQRRRLRCARPSSAASPRCSSRRATPSPKATASPWSRP